MRQIQFHSRRARPIRWALIGLSALALLAACMGGSSNNDVATVTASIDPTATSLPVPSEPPTATVTETSEPVLEPTPTSELLPAPVQLAVEEAARSHDVPAESITVLSFTERQWPSTALGCPQSGRSYAQIMTPGYEVRLAIEDQRVTYHTDSQTTVIECTSG